jgi:hypothetical protein
LIAAGIPQSSARGGDVLHTNFCEFLFAGVWETGGKLDLARLILPHYPPTGGTVVRKIFLAGALALMACGASAALADNVSSDAAGPPCQLPVTKVYRIKPGYCPQALVAMIPNAVGPGCCGCQCGPYGIPPIYAAGQNVLVRQTPEMQERITEFLTELGALVPKKAR